MFLYGIVIFGSFMTQICIGKEFVNQFAVHVLGGHNEANRIARETGLINKGQIGTLDHHYLFEIPNRAKRSTSHSQDHHDALDGHGEVLWFEQQTAHSRKKRDFHPHVAEPMIINDNYWDHEWYLRGGGKGSHGNTYDMNVASAWKEGYTGKDIVVAILDDGLEHDHPDLSRNYDPFASYDLNDRDFDPMPRYDPTNENRHGTRCAGEVSSEANNTVCTIGIAPDSKIGGIRMLDGEVYDAVEAASLSYNKSHIDIYSASWGPDDDGKVVDGPGKLAKKAFIDGVQKGRGGKGSIFVWASGNGGSALDSCNCDGYANSIFTLSISSTSENGRKPWYLEECASTLTTTYSSGAYNERQIASTDLRKQCTKLHTGTSASAPLAAGIVALVLEANPALTWRDMQYITLMTSRPEPMMDGEWITNGVGRKVSLRYGYGLMDAFSMVKLAKVWRNVPEKQECLIQSQVNNARLAGGSNTYTSTVQTDGCRGTSTEVRHLEHVQARVTLKYASRGRVIIYLTSPKGTRSKILPARRNDFLPGEFKDWPLLSVQFWGEDPEGVWTLEIEESNEHGNPSGGGTLSSWSLVLHGTKIQPVRLLNETAETQPSGNKVASVGINTENVKQVTDSTATTKSGASQPVSCHEECAQGCHGTGPQDCTQCKHFTLQHSRACVASCPVGTYIYESVCMPCDATCETCVGPALTECKTCPSGHAVNTIDKHTICSAECIDGFFRRGAACVQCGGQCKTCQDSADRCTSCSDKDVLKGQKCFAKGQGLSAVFEGVTLSIVVIFVTALLIVILLGGFIFSYTNKLFCFAVQNDYDLVPREDRECEVKLTYSDDLED